MPEARRCIQSLSDYQAPIVTRAMLNLDLNENASGCSPRVLAKLRSLTSDVLARYPQRETGEQIVANWLGLPPACVLLTNGIDEALQLIFGAYLDDHREVLIAEPTFPMYARYGQASGANVRIVHYDENFAFPIEAIISSITEATRVIVVANPNNPTGTIAPADQLTRLLEGAPHAIVVVDEAYFEFYGCSMIGRLSDFHNLVVTRTFSKAYGLAGLRLGVVVGASEQISNIRKLCSPFNVNAIAMACLPDALEDKAFVLSYVSQVEDGRIRLQKLCDRLQIRTWPSCTNFVLARIGRRTRDFVSDLRRHSIAVSDRSLDWACAGCIRVTIGTPEQMTLLLEKFEHCFTNLSAG